MGLEIQARVRLSRQTVDGMHSACQLAILWPVQLPCAREKAGKTVFVTGVMGLLGGLVLKYTWSRLKPWSQLRAISLIAGGAGEHITQPSCTRRL